MPGTGKLGKRRRDNLMGGQAAVDASEQNAAYNSFEETSADELSGSKLQMASGYNEQHSLSMFDSDIHY